MESLHILSEPRYAQKNLRELFVKSDVADKSSISILGGYSVITCEFLLDVRVIHPIAAINNLRLGDHFRKDPEYITLTVLGIGRTLEHNLHPYTILCS